MKLKKEELVEVVKQLGLSNVEEKACFAICEYRDTERYFIKANKEGLEFFAKALLEASMILDEREEEGEDLIPLAFEGEWLLSEGVIIDYVQLINREGEVEDEPDQLTFIDQLISLGCLTIFLFLIFSMIVGIATMMNWFLMII